MLETGVEGERDMPPLIAIKQELPKTSGDNMQDAKLQDIIVPCGALPNIDQIRGQEGRGLEFSKNPSPVHRDIETLIRHNLGKDCLPCEDIIFESAVFKEAQQLISQNCVLESFLRAACEELSIQETRKAGATLPAQAGFAEANLMMELQNEVKETI